LDSIILIGGGGHCLASIDVILSQNKYTILGIIDKNKGINKSITSFQYLGDDKSLPTLISKYKNALITIGQIRSNYNRVKIFNLLKKLNAFLPTIISPRAYLAFETFIGEGNIIMHNALINAGASIGNNCIINTKSLIEHEVKIGSHCHISTSTTLNGGVKIDDGTFVGSNSVIYENVKIGKNCIVPAGSIVRKDLPNNSIFRE